MAGTSANDFQSGAPFYLDPNQQDLLLAALASNTQNSNDLFASDGRRTMDSNQFQYPVDGLDPAFFTSPQTLNNVSIEESPYVDYIDGAENFDFDGVDGNDLMIGALPGDSPNQNDSEDSPEKRKTREDDTEDPDGGGKRREPEDKQAKKPGRKPLTSEPTTKRKAQNRAAQRAFRERKEKHLKDLEVKVSELEKASDATNHENGLLRAQVQRLQMELREYRKRLSLNSSSVTRSATLGGGFSSMLSGSGSTNSTFQFEFPRFGGQPGSHLFDNGPLAKSNTKSASVSSSTAPSRHDSTTRSMSPKSQGKNSISQSPTQISSATSLGALNGSQVSGLYNHQFDYSTMASSPNQANRSNTDASSTPSSRIFQFNSGSSTHSSPSASSNSQVGQNSSCDTSPEPSHNSPTNPDTITDGYVCHGNSEGEISFCEKLNMACGNPRNPIPRAMSLSDAHPSLAAPAKTPAPATDVNGIDFFANQNGGQFDPTLFGDYRDSQNAIVGDGDFTNGFFNDAFPLTDFGSPFHFGDTPAIQKSNPLEEIERLQDGEEEVVPGEDTSQMLNCHKIWDKLASRDDFKNGTIDIDNLCSELRAKARCSESGVVVDHKDVEAALKRFPAQ